MAISVVGFLKETREELKKVVWPTSQEVIRLTLLVVVVSVLVGFYIGALDFIFTWVTETLIK